MPRYNSNTAIVFVKQQSVNQSFINALSLQLTIQHNTWQKSIKKNIRTMYK